MRPALPLMNRNFGDMVGDVDVDRESHARAIPGTRCLRDDGADGVDELRSNYATFDALRNDLAFDAMPLITKGFHLRNKRRPQAAIDLQLRSADSLNLS